MSADRSRYGLVVSALGAIVLAVSVFLPWYGLSLTPAGIGFIQQLSDHFVSQFGNAAAQSYVNGLHANLSSLAGQEFTAVDAHVALKDLSVVLLILAALAILDSLFPLARAGGQVPDGAGRSVVLLGCIAAICVLYRMVDPPDPAANLVALSLREGAWLALLGSVTMVIGGLWPRYQTSAPPSEERKADPFVALSGWTPQG
jgi:hypothetical protein